MLRRIETIPIGCEGLGAEREDYVACIILARYVGLHLHEGTAIARKALKDGFITIKGKDGKIRELPINESISAVLNKAFLLHRRATNYLCPRTSRRI